MWERYSWFCAASPRSAWSTSRSVRPGGSARGRPNRMSAGTTLSMNSSSDAAPTSYSIARVSSGLGPMWRVTKRSAGSSEARAVGMLEGLFANLLLILLAPQQLVELFRTFHPEPDHPALAVGVAVHEGRVICQCRVDLGDRAGERGKELRDRLHRFDRPEHVHARERRPDLGEVDVHDVAQLALCIIGDPDLHDRRVVGLLDVLVLFGVAQVRRRFRHAGFALARGVTKVGAKVTGALNPCQPNGLADGNRSGRGATPRPPGSTSRSRSAPHGRKSSRTATGSGSSLKRTSRPGRPARSHARSTLAAAPAVATMASGGGSARASAFSTALPPVTRRTANPASE